jgi:hypothetical protein
MKEKMKRVSLLNLYGLLMEMKSQKNDKRVQFAVVRNLEYFEPEIKSLREIQKNSPRFEEYVQKRRELGELYADKDESGQPKIVIVENQQVFQITEKKEEANSKIFELMKEYNDVIEEKNQSIKQLSELMNEEIEVDVCKVSFDFLPEDANYGILKSIIKETPEEIEAKYL